MPELPEVQTIVSDLVKILPGFIIRDVWTDWQKTIKNPKKFSDFKKAIIGKKILGVKRKGKNILIGLSGGKTLLVHQKLTGHLLYGKWSLKDKKWQSASVGPFSDDPRNKFLHLVITFSNGKNLALSDVRKFAKVLVWDTDKLDTLKDLKEIGVEPLSEDFTFKKFKEAVGRKRGKIRDLLLNQEIVAGIGNIYVSEILWEAGVYPFKEGSELTETELKKIYSAILKILKRAVKARGDSIIDFRDIHGNLGGYQKLHKAYQMEGKKCSKNDGGIIKRFKQKGRSAFFCPAHQKP